MTSLVTRGGGYIGSHMTHALVDAGETVAVVDYLSTGFRAALPASAKLVVGDVGNEALLANVSQSFIVNVTRRAASLNAIPNQTMNHAQKSLSVNLPVSNPAGTPPMSLGRLLPAAVVTESTRVPWSRAS